MGKTKKKTNTLKQAGTSKKKVRKNQTEKVPIMLKTECTRSDTMRAVFDILLNMYRHSLFLTIGENRAYSKSETALCVYKKIFRKNLEFTRKEFNIGMQRNEFYPINNKGMFYHQRYISIESFVGEQVGIENKDTATYII